MRREPSTYSTGAVNTDEVSVRGLHWAMCCEPIRIKIWNPFNTRSPGNTNRGGRCFPYMTIFRTNFVNQGPEAWPETPEDGFMVYIAQPGIWPRGGNKLQAPASAGAAVSRIRLYAVPDADTLKAPIVYPPADLPRRHIFWREGNGGWRCSSTKQSGSGR